MKIILDTNVIIAAFAAHGLSHSVFELCIDRFEIYGSAEIMEEVERNLKKKLRLSKKIIEEIILYLKENTIIEEVEEIPRGICRDSEDDFILGLVEKTQADYLITGDKDLLIMNAFGSTKIITPRQFWEIIRNNNKA